MERQLLTILNFDLSFTEDELICLLGPLLQPVVEPLKVPTPEALSMVVEQTQEPMQAQVQAQAREQELTAAAVARQLQADARDDEVAERRPYRSIVADDSDTDVEETEMVELGKRLTPEYPEDRRPTITGPLPSEALSRELPALPAASPPAAAEASTTPERQPTLRNRDSTYSVASTNSCGSRPPSWSDREDGPSPRSSGTDSCSPRTRRARMSRMSSRMSVSTVSSTSSGPRTPPTPLDVAPPLPTHYEHLVVGKSQQHEPIQFVDSFKQPRRVSTTPTSSPRHHSRQAAKAVNTYSAPSPSLLYACAHDPDLWPLIASTAVSAQGQRKASGDVRRVSGAELSERAGRLPALVAP